MTYERPMFPPRAGTKHLPCSPAGVPARNTCGVEVPPPWPAQICATAPKVPEIGRRGLLGAFLALVPATAAAGAVASLTTSAPPARESRRLVWLGEQLDQTAAQLTAAIARESDCRAVAQQRLPEPPAEITFEPGRRPPAWCGVESERDVDGKIAYYRGNERSARKIAWPPEIESFLKFEDGRTREAKAARRVLAMAREYWDARERAIEGAGYWDAAEAAHQISRRIDRIAVLIYKCECSSFWGLAIKARALTVAAHVDAVNGYFSGRSAVLYAGKLADDVLRVRATV
ncbi:MAG: hypothetical protein HY852_03500 [Bradyrhizobium sp.]|uniref:hypothetical protein n=1 Tax=Bradyrhizobium sp. TaxID=376 RepID=UPI0025BD4154|nr:hypothetical protein [Bradyrhizobium sp.]MBI5260868.1 hypothetical protein [Bradyrhizobium sp.]